jgi:hypothetical protein
MVDAPHSGCLIVGLGRRLGTFGVITVSGFAPQASPTAAILFTTCYEHEDWSGCFDDIGCSGPRKLSEETNLVDRDEYYGRAGNHPDRHPQAKYRSV